MKMRAAVLVLFLLAAGCSVAWDRSKITGPQLAADLDACRAVATGGRLELQETLSGSTALLLPVATLDHSAFAACMRERGYEQGYVD